MISASWINFTDSDFSLDKEIVNFRVRDMKICSSEILACL